MAKKTKFLEPGRLSSRNLWGYSMGGIGRDMAYQLINTYILIFVLFAKSLTTAQFATISAVMIGCRIFDGLNDPFMGTLVERTRTKIGKFKPWIIAGALTNVAVIMALFWVPLYGNNYVIFFSFGYLLWGITYTMNDISYWGMLPSLTSNEQDRNNLSTLANVGAGAGAALAMLAIPTLTGGGSLQIGGNAITAYGVISAIVCIVFVACQFMTCFVVKEKPLPEKGSAADTEKTTIKGMFQVIFKNDQLLITAGSMLLYNIGSAIMNGLSMYLIYFRYGYQGTLVTVFTVLAGVTAAFMVFYPLLVKKFTRKQISIISLILILVGYTLLLVIGLAIPSTALGAFTVGGLTIPWTFVLLAFSGTFASCGHVFFYMVLTISISNTVEYNELKTGKRQEGIIFALRPLMAKLGSALQLGIITIVLIALGVNGITGQISDIENNVYTGNLKTEFVQVFEEDPDLFFEEVIPEESLEDAVKLYNENEDEFFETYLGDYKAYKVENIISDVKPSVTQWLIVCMSVIPMVLLTLGIVFWLVKYKITEVKYQEICAEIAARNGTINLGGDVQVASDEIPNTPINELGDAVVSATESEDAKDDLKADEEK